MNKEVIVRFDVITQSIQKGNTHNTTNKLHLFDKLTNDKWCEHGTSDSILL